MKGRGLWREGKAAAGGGPGVGAPEGESSASILKPIRNRETPSTTTSSSSAEKKSIALSLPPCCTPTGPLSSYPCNTSCSTTPSSSSLRHGLLLGCISESFFCSGTPTPSPRSKPCSLWLRNLVLPLLLGPYPCSGGSLDSCSSPSSMHSN